MADEQRKVTDLSTLAAAPARNDKIHIVDVSDTTDGLDGTSKGMETQYLTPSDTNPIKDANGNKLLEFEKVTSAVNNAKIKNSATGNAVEFSAVGDDDNINLKNKGKGTGVVQNDGETIELIVTDFTTDLTTGDGKAYVTIPSKLNGMLLDMVHGSVITGGTTGTTDIQIHNVTDGNDMLSTKLTIDSGETDSHTAATPAVIDENYNVVSTNDKLRIDIDSVSTTPPKGLIVRLEFRNP